MKLVSIFVEGSVEAAVAFVNEQRLASEFMQLMCGTRQWVHMVAGETQQGTTLGHNILLRVSDQRANTLAKLFGAFQ